ncbi:MAG: tRNA-binding protein [Parasphingorhabdus sp.]|jgi:tRNA-binding protein
MTPAPIKPIINFDDISKIDLRVGTITAVDDVPKSRKLVALIVSFGDHQRTILSGMKNERENLQELVGQQALFVVNLESRKMAGMLSEGMLFDLGYEDGITPVLAQPEATVPAGTRAG